MRINKTERISKIIGIGFDDSDGQTRITQGLNFELRQGSEETHREMMETCLKIEERIKASGKALEDLTREEFLELVSDLK